MVAPVIFVILALIAAPPATDIIAGDTIDSNSNTMLQALEQVGEKYPLIGKNKVERINERIQELEKAKSSKAAISGTRNLDKEIGGEEEQEQFRSRRLEALNSALERVPDQAKPAIQLAIQAPTLKGVSLANLQEVGNAAQRGARISIDNKTKSVVIEEQGQTRRLRYS